MSAGENQNNFLEGNEEADASERNTLAKMPRINVYDTDCGELKQLTYNDRYAEFGVSKPIKLEDYIVYETTGYDSSGPFTGQKRYSDFYQLRAVLSRRWPGFFIPAVPPKQTIVSGTHFRLTTERRETWSLTS